MERHEDFNKIVGRFTSQYKQVEGTRLYNNWLESKGYDQTKPFPKSTERKEKRCTVVGLEIKEGDLAYHVEGLIATTHIDSLDTQEGIDIPDRITKETLEDFAYQMNNDSSARVMGVHHSEGRQINAEYFGEADVTNNPARVIPLSDGEWGLYADTKLLKDDPQTPEIIKEFEDGTLNSYSITYDTKGFSTSDFEWDGDKIVRVLQPGTILYGYTAASNPVNENAVATAFGFKEFKELIGKKLNSKEVKQMERKEEESMDSETVEKEISEVSDEAPVEEASVEPSADEPEMDESEQKEFRAFKKNKRALEEKAVLERTANKVAERVLEKMEVKEKVLSKNTVESSSSKDVAFEIKEFNAVINEPKNIELKEQFRRAAAVCELKELDWRSATTSAAESREYKNFGVNGTKLEFKALGITTNQNTDTDYLQSSAELQDIYDPIIYNGLNQETVTWNLLAKDDFSKKGNNQVQFTLKTAANTSAAFYSGNSVTTGNVTRLKYQTKFKKLQVGVSVDGDMIAAARGGPVSDVFAQEVMDSTMDMLAVLNVALFAEVGLETADAVIGFEYITDSAGNTSLYNLTRSAANRLAPTSAGDTYINQASTIISMTNLRSAIRQAVLESANKSNLVFITNPVQADLLRSKFDDQRRMLTMRDTDFGFATDLFVDGIPVFTDKDCNTDDWFLIDLETHRVGMWIPPTIERLGKSADNEEAFVKMYFATYNRAPRRMVQIYGAATS